MLISAADVAREVARQPIMVLMVLEEIVEEGVVFASNKMAQKRDYMSCVYCLVKYMGLTTRYLLLVKSATGKTTVGPPILAVMNPMVV